MVDVYIESRGQLEIFYILSATPQLVMLPWVELIVPLPSTILAGRFINQRPCLLVI